MGAIQATVFDIHDTKSTPHSLLSSPRLLVSIYARTLEIDIWISMSHALLRESSPLSKTWTGRPCPHTTASSAVISRVCLTVNFRWNEKLCWQHSPSIPWKRIFVVRPRDRTGGSVFFFLSLDDGVNRAKRARIDLTLENTVRSSLIRFFSREIPSLISTSFQVNSYITIIIRR